MLLEANFELLLEGNEERMIVFSVGNIREDAHEIVAVYLVLMLPLAADHLCFCGNRPESPPEFQKGLSDKFIRYRLTIVKPQGQQDLEPPERTAHKWPAPRRRMEYLARPDCPTQRTGLASRRWTNS